MKNFKTYIAENAEARKHGYMVVNHWKDRGQEHMQLRKTHDDDSKADRHQSVITMEKEKDGEPKYRAVHMVEPGYWINQSRHQPVDVHHKSEHKTLSDAIEALKKHTDKFYKK